MSIPPEISKPTIIVPCAIIDRDGHIFAAQRNNNMSLPLKWEFPGGKVDEGENETEALHREIMEELSVEIEIGTRLSPTFKEDTHRIICLVPYVCHLISSPIILTEHLQYRWIRWDDVYSLDWAEADLGVIATYSNYLESRKLRRNKCKITA